MSRAHHNCLMTKHPRYGSMTGWHRDMRFWSFEREDLVSVWLALGEETIDNGALWFVPGSHTACSTPIDSTRRSSSASIGPTTPARAHRRIAASRSGRCGVLPLQYPALRRQESQRRREVLARLHLPWPEQRAEAGTRSDSKPELRWAEGGCYRLARDPRLGAQNKATLTARIAASPMVSAHDDHDRSSVAQFRGVRPPPRQQSRPLAARAAPRSASRTPRRVPRYRAPRRRASERGAPREGPVEARAGGQGRIAVRDVRDIAAGCRRPCAPAAARRGRTRRGYAACPAVTDSIRTSTAPAQRRRRAGRRTDSRHGVRPSGTIDCAQQ